ncbi:ATP-binding cassette domain-containing protein [Alsobacter sp. SYSU M60028]|uniref:ATP-binding cassette domain-containing protein n=1 Tax=Alsobacter ponti TaxID=2962936 RepID=A0ABT1LEC5_9HYPH|nr:oligopeptide/dipeptide ABC transporter ATP-binding protein [Alsobacter ponti]MCP8939448.1 ATP-binding cassette domain-containing protein [Alsobacter ponti]
MSEALLRVEGLTKLFGSRRRVGLFGPSRAGVRAVDDVNFAVAPGETLALVGESGCGKSTTGRLLLRLIEPTSGRVLFRGRDIASAGARDMHAIRKHLQIIFQDPYGSLSPRRTVVDIVAEPLEAHGMVRNAAERRERVAGLLERVGLSPDSMNRYPREFSGGQRQRIGIARALGVGPAFIVADEPVSALDVSVQAQIVNLLQDLQEEQGLSYLFISHDLRVVRHIAHRVAVMYLGRIVEEGPKEQIFTAPQHPYSQALLSAAPEPGPARASRRIILQGDVPSPTAIPSGCGFRTRCPLAQPVCAQERPALREVAPGQRAACHFAAPNPIPAPGGRAPQAAA